MVSQLIALPTDTLTPPSLTDPFGRDSQDSENLHYYLYSQVLHCFGQPHSNVGLKTFEKVFYSAEEINERVLACANILNCLQSVMVRVDYADQGNYAP